MSSSAGASTQKRKVPHNVQESSSDRKRQKIKDARTIRGAAADAALSTRGELNIASFIKSRENEIRVLDESMKTCRQVLTNRAFQQVPRHMRRRTASHNAKKVPRRLRGRATKEMIEDNTDSQKKKKKITSRMRLRLETAHALQRLSSKRKTVRQKKREARMNAIESDPMKHLDVVRVPKRKNNKLADPPLATSKFKRRQVSKTWLPTHLWHTKRAHMTRPTEPLWRMALPLRSTEKSYRAIHRTSGSRGCVVTDTSYVSTVACRGTDASLEGLLKSFAFHGNGWSGPKYTRWKTGSRFASGWICKQRGREALAIIDILWIPTRVPKDEDVESAAQVEVDVEISGVSGPRRKRRTKLDRQFIIRIHASVFNEFWKELLRIAKLQKPQVLVEDLRFEIGSIEITGPQSTEALVSSLHLISTVDETVGKVWDTLRLLPNPSLLPLNIIMNVDIQDPRLSTSSKEARLFGDAENETSIHELAAAWPLDDAKIESSLFFHKARYIAGKLPSVWTVHRRRQAIARGESLAVPQKNPSIPVVLLAHRANTAMTTQQGTWTLLAPWKCVDVIWRKLVSCSLSGGIKPRFGGLEEKRQIAFEQDTPWYPGDFPGTDAGKCWERSQAERRFDEWIKRPPSRRIAWNRLDLGLDRRGELGRGWACDWEYLLEDTESGAGHPGIPATATAASTEHQPLRPRSQPILTQRQRKAAKAKIAAEDEQARRNTSSPEDEDTVDATLVREKQFIQFPPQTAKSLLQHMNVSNLPDKAALATVKIEFLARGTPTDAARIYRLPTPKHDPTGLHGSVDSEPSLNLRNRWIALDPANSPQNTFARLQGERVNHRNLPRQAQYYSPEGLRHINVLPKDPHPSILERYGPKPLTEDEKIALRAEEMAVQAAEKKVWDTHVPCPDASDLIGFVTSGNYNLAQGRGTALGAIWVQRVIQGWKDETNIPSGNPATRSATTTKDKVRKQVKAHQHRDRERHLCIVRNAGESVGRLALWQLCQQ